MTFSSRGSHAVSAAALKFNLMLAPGVFAQDKKATMSKDCHGKRHLAYLNSPRETLPERLTKM